MDIWVLIPAYKPGQRMLAFLSQLQNAGFRVLLVDDGSGPEYAPVFMQAQNNGIPLLSHDVNKGKGRALKTGFQYLLRHAPEAGVVTADCDGQHTLADVRRVASALEENPAKLIVGARALKDKVPLRSRFGNTSMRLIFALATGTYLHDTQTGLRGVPPKLLPKLVTLSGERYEYEMNMLLSLRSWGVQAMEIPISTIYENNNAGSHFRTFRDAFRVCAQILRFVAVSLGCYVLDYSLYSLFLGFSATWLAYGMARSVSATANYLLNRHVVFKRGRRSSALRYFLLAGTVMAIGALSTNILSMLGISDYLAKLPVDFLLFFLNYVAQREFVFSKTQEN